MKKIHGGFDILIFLFNFTFNINLIITITITINYALPFINIFELIRYKSVFKTL